MQPIRDLSDPAQGPHAVQLVAGLIEQALAEAWQVPVHRTMLPERPRIGSARPSCHR